MTTKTNSCEGGSNGTGVTAGNSGGASGTAWDLVSAGTGGTITYDTAAKWTGTLGITFTPGSGASCLTRWTGFSSMSGVQRVYVTDITLPASTTESLVRFMTAGGVTVIAVQIQSTGKYVVQDAAGAITTASTITWSAGDRIEVSFTIGTTTSNGSYTVNVYRGDSTTVAWSVTSAAANLGTTAWDMIQYGKAAGSSTWTGPVRMDDAAAAGGTTTMFGPVALPVPTANAGANQADIEPFQSTGAATVVTQTGSASGGSGSGYTYQWVQLSGPTVALSGATTATVSFPAPTATSFGAAQTVTLGLTVTDSASTSSPQATVTFTFLPWLEGALNGSGQWVPLCIYSTWP